jgi:muramoyltetrapeptide carboxypeptidase LdcA involved in peptidoglycan recycling
LHSGSRLVAVGPGTWWENPDQEARLLQCRCAEAGWTLEVPSAAMGRWRWFSGADASRRAQLEKAWADPATAERYTPARAEMGPNGSAWFPSLGGCVLLLEDVGEAP